MPQQTPDSQLRALKLICFALPTGAALFTLIAFFIGSEGSVGEQAVDVSVLRVILVVMAFILIPLSFFLRKKVLSGKQPMKSGNNSFANRCFASSIIQMALIEGLTLFSAVILLTISQSVKQADPISYLHLIPLFLLTLVARSVYPSTEKIEALRQQYEPAP
jgi:hypothetical protein